MTRRAAPATERTSVEPWILLSFGLPFAAVLFSLTDVNDLAYHLRAGSLMIETGALLRHDVFTFTLDGGPWVNQQWGAQLLLSPLYEAIGWRGLVVVRALVVSACTGSTFVAARRQGADPLVAGALTLGGFTVAALLPGTLALRPQLLALPLSVVSIMLLTTQRDHPRRLAWLVPIAVVWANLHGSFVLLVVLCAAAALGEFIRIRRLPWAMVIVTVGVAFAPLATPWGWETYGYVVDVATSPLVRRIDEWRPLWERWPAGPALVAVGILVGISLPRHRRHPIDPVDVALGTVLTALAIASGRNVIWWGLALPLLGARMLDPTWRPGSPAPRRLTTAVAAVLVVACVAGLARVARTEPVEALLGEAPAGLSTAVDAWTDPGDRVFVARWGSWFELAVPDVRVAVDARVELFPDEVWDAYTNVVTAREGWEEILDGWEVDVVVAGHGDHASLVRALDGAPAWERAYEDDDGVVFVRAPTG